MILAFPYVGKNGLEVQKRLAKEGGPGLEKTELTEEKIGPRE